MTFQNTPKNQCRIEESKLPTGQILLSSRYIAIKLHLSGINPLTLKYSNGLMSDKLRKHASFTLMF